jgi:hypothetical protein
MNKAHDDVTNKALWWNTWSRWAALEAREALELGIKGGARNLGRTDIGEIAPGFAADFVAWRTDSIGFAGGQHDVVAGLVFLTPCIGFVDLSVINGDVIVRDGKFTSLDLPVWPRRLGWLLSMDAHSDTALKATCALVFVHGLVSAWLFEDPKQQILPTPTPQFSLSSLCVCLCAPPLPLLLYLSTLSRIGIVILTFNSWLSSW